MASVSISPGISNIDPNADAEMLGNLQAAVELFAEAVVEEAKARVHKITGGLEASITAEPVTYENGGFTVNIHDGPGDRGREYGIYEEVVRGGEHAFLRPAMDSQLPLLQELLREAVGKAGG